MANCSKKRNIIAALIVYLYLGNRKLKEAAFFFKQTLRSHFFGLTKITFARFSSALLDSGKTYLAGKFFLKAQVVL